MDKIQHSKPKISQYAPHRWSVPVYGKILQTTSDTSERNILDKKATKRIWSVVGTMLYHAQSLYLMILREINEI